MWNDNKFKDLDLDVWYYGNKKITTVNVRDNEVELSNKDVIFYDKEKLKINDEIISNIKDLEENEIFDLYISYLKNKGYKILNG